MAKPLSDILKGVKTSKIEPGSTGKRPGVDYAPKSKGDQDFVAKHKTEKHADRVGNEDNVYKGTTKYALDKASENKHGYDEDGSIKVYESVVSETTEVHGFRALVSRDNEPNKRVRFHVKTNSVKDGHEIAAKHLESKGYKVHLTQHIGKINPLFGKPVNEEALDEATVKQINDRMDSLMAAKKAEKAGNKQAQYSHMSDYHSKFATHVNNKDDIAHHKSQAEIYRSASKAFEEAVSCNMTEEGKYCPVHEMTSCKEQKTLREKDKKINEEKHVFHVHIPSLDTRLHKMVDPENDGKTSEPIGNKPKPDRLKITVPGDRRTATNKAAKYVAKNYGTNVKFTYSHKVDESLVAPLLGGSDGDESAEMAKTQLRALANKALALAMHLNDDQVVEPWVQAKIAVAKDNVTAVHDYMVYGDHDKPEKEQTSPMDTPMTFPNMNVDVNTGVNV
jgi:hypothetical protein